MCECGIEYPHNCHCENQYCVRVLGLSDAYTNTDCKMMDAEITKTSWVVVPWWRLWGLSQLGTAFVLGIVGAIFFSLSDRGFNDAAKFIALAVLVLPVPMAAMAIRNGTRTGWSRLGQRTLQRVMLGLAWSPLSFVAFFVGLILVGRAIVPDPGPFYFQFRKSYIERHWQIDAKTGRRYFVIDYGKVSGGPYSGEFIPRNFFIVDDGSFYVRHYFSSSFYNIHCLTSKYSARKVDDRIYLVRAYIDDVGEEMLPCLITPTPNPAN
jgi:hypothetical protein